MVPDENDVPENIDFATFYNNDPDLGQICQDLKAQGVPEEKINDLTDRIFITPGSKTDDMVGAIGGILKFIIPAAAAYYLMEEVQGPLTYALETPDWMYDTMQWFLSFFAGVGVLLKTGPSRDDHNKPTPSYMPKDGYQEDLKRLNRLISAYPNEMDKILPKYIGN